MTAATVPKLVLPGTMAQGLAEYCRQVMPNEAIGLLGVKTSEEEGTTNELAAWAPLKNCSPNPAESFFVQPYDQQRAYNGLIMRGFCPVGAFHSHPRGSAYPSKFDFERLERDPEHVMMIVAMEAEARFTCWCALGEVQLELGE